MGPLAEPTNWAIVLVTAFIIGIVIALHYEMLQGCIRFLPSLAHRRRRRVVILIFVILFTHAVEIWIFAFGYYFLLQFERFGNIIGSVDLVTMVDHAYFSGMVYTTVGFGDFVPHGPIRFTAGMEALTGLVMITWSASFTFLEMQRDWPHDRRV